MVRAVKLSGLLALTLIALSSTASAAERRIVVFDPSTNPAQRVALAQAAVEAVGENRVAVQQLVTYLRTRVAEGASPEGDAIRAEVERDRADADVTMAEVELVRARAALRRWLGAGAAPLEALRVAMPAAAEVGAPLVPFSGFAARALAERPELAGARARVEALTSAIDVERSLRVRELGASLGVKRTDGANGMVAGLSVSLPLFDQNAGEIQRATGERVAAAAELRWLEGAVSSEVEAAYQSATRLIAQVAALETSSLRRAEESRDIALGAFREGAAPLLQVLDASRALTDARLIHARALVAASESIFELGIAAGYDTKAAARLGVSR